MSPYLLGAYTGCDSRCWYNIIIICGCLDVALCRRLIASCLAGSCESRVEVTARRTTLSDAITTDNNVITIMRMALIIACCCCRYVRTVASLGRKFRRFPLCSSCVLPFIAPCVLYTGSSLPGMRGIYRVAPVSYTHLTLPTKRIV